jgi:hypothetical protein
MRHWALALIASPCFAAYKPCINLPHSGFSEIFFFYIFKVDFRPAEKLPGRKQSSEGLEDNHF